MVRPRVGSARARRRDPGSNPGSSAIKALFRELSVPGMNFIVAVAA